MGDGDVGGRETQGDLREGLVAVPAQANPLHRCRSPVWWMLMRRGRCWPWGQFGQLVEASHLVTDRIRRTARFCAPWARASPSFPGLAEVRSQEMVTHTAETVTEKAAQVRL